MAIETSELFDTEILVGKGPNSKIFRLHSYILKAFSPYFRTALSIKKDNNNNIIKLKKPNISIEIFDIIIKYLYCGKLIATNDVKTNVEILIAADELRIKNLCTHIEEYLLSNKELLKKNYIFIRNFSFKYAKYTKLSQFCKDAFQKDPSLIFNSKDFTKIKREILLDILIKNNHNLKSIEIYDKIMEWIITQSNELSSDNIKLFIQQFIPYINFKEIEPSDFLKKIKPLRNIFDDKIYSKILEYYSFNNMNGISKIINFDSLLLLSKIIEIAETNNCSTNTINLYNFKLLIRGSQNGFNYKTFHEFCDNKGPTITIAKIKGVDEFIGGYNPNNWGSSNNWTKKSFIFSLNQNNLINSIISKEIHNDSKKSNYIEPCGPEFGSDLILLLSNNENNNKGRCCRNNYEKRIRNNDETDFEIEEYEVFRVYKNFY
ncbi:BTB-domain-containing protein [Rhizophagus irregularis]|uniref:BTB-domain-containing protein n=1 Tax=Rhizophagus irregularis TaxID=588596 RepID=A0A2N1MNS9_9GLOM|nr:BTB-domain-containing protein [Rhizophagus irregularis]